MDVVNIQDLPMLGIHWSWQNYRRVFPSSAHEFCRIVFIKWFNIYWLTINGTLVTVAICVIGPNQDRLWLRFTLQGFNVTPSLFLLKEAYLNTSESEIWYYVVSHVPTAEKKTSQNLVA